MRSRWWALSSCEEWSRARRVPSRDAAVVDRSQERCVFESNRDRLEQLHEVARRTRTSMLLTFVLVPPSHGIGDCQ